MDESAKVTLPDWVVIAVGIVLLAGGLLMLSLPVYLDDYDRYGIRVECGTGYSGQLLQAMIDDQDQPVAGHVDRCNSALAHRRAWAIPVAGLGVLMLVGKAIAWTLDRAGSGAAGSTDTWSETPDEYMHEAAVLDRRERAHRDRPPGTTM